MKASVVIPNHRSEATLPRTLRSLEAAAAGLDVEILVSDDPDGRGLSWARNQGLARARGEIVFFVDADDTVQPAYFRRHLEVMAATGADFMLSSVAYAPLKRLYDLSGNAAVRAALLPAFYGYSFDDVRRWNAGGVLSARREQGGVWRAAFRRSFLTRHRIRFDERLRLYEDAPFLAECAAHAERVISIPDRLYNYVPGENGILATSLGTRRHWEYKFAALAARQAIDRRAGGQIGAYCAASHVLSALEMLVLWRRAGLSAAEFRTGLRRYLSEPVVRAALAAFPLSARHPLVAAAVAGLRLAATWAPGTGRNGGAGADML